MSQAFQLYRFHHADGRAKDWAWRRDPAGSLTVRWGPAGRLAQHKTYPSSAASQLQRTITAKSRKGYLLLGERELDAQGQVLDRPPPAATPRTTGTAVHPVIDLPRIDTGIEDGWF